MRSNIIIWVVVISCVLLMWLIGRLYHELLNVFAQSTTLTDTQYSWFFRLLLNLTGYSTILVPGFILYKYLHKINYFQKITNPSCLSRCLHSCFGEFVDKIPETKTPKVEGDQRRESVELLFCFTGLMGAYLVWGLLQEKIMTQKYELPDGSVVRFKDSQVLVFVNRLVALLVAAGQLVVTRRPVLPAPLYPFSYSALTNVVSAWCQYEALKYVSFPTQVLSKSCKVVPVMLMGSLISRAKYATYEYVTAALISFGMALFMLGSRAEHAASAETSWCGGAALLALYLCCDSFTSSWQAALFQRSHASPLQMLCAVNCCSCALTAAALLHSRTLYQAAAFMQNPIFVGDCLILSLSSAVGQLFIYRTISKFGAVVFTIIMTLRQAVSVVMSCLVYGHGISVAAGGGAALVFIAVALRIYCRQRTQRTPTRTDNKL